MEQPKYDVFISYSRKDTAIADKISTAFDQAGITYFIDRQGIGGGMEFPAVLAKAIRESHIFLFLASKNSYESKFTQSEIVYAFNKKQKQDIIPYIIDGSTMPDELEFTFSAINWRRIENHPIDTTLVDDILLKIGKTRKPVEETVTSGSGQHKAEQGTSPKKSFLPKKFNFTGKHLAIIVLSTTVALLIWSIFASKSFVQSHSETIDNVIMVLMIATFIMAVIGYIRPASICLPNRKEVSKFYLSALFVMFITFGIFIEKSPNKDKQNATIEPIEQAEESAISTINTNSTTSNETIEQPEEQTPPRAKRR